MIQRIDRLQTELPPPSSPDPAGAAVVQELLGGKFGELSTFMNYTFQSFNFRARQQARPFFDLVSNIAAEEFGGIELLLDHDQHDADGRPRRGRQRAAPQPPPDVKGILNPQQFLAGGAGRAPAELARAAPGTATTSFRLATSSRT